MNIAEKFINTHELTKEEYVELIRLAESDVQVREQLKEEAVRLQKKYYGSDVYTRGLIEFTNYCRNNCYYCGIRNGNRNTQRYRLTKEEILDCCANGYELGFRTFVLQGGEDPYYTDEKLAEIVDFAVVDKDGKLTNTIEKGSKFQIKMRIHFHESIQQPIMAFTFKNIQGTEITGTNTMYEGVNVEHTDAGDECVVVFEQKMDMQGGEYLLSFGCTGYRNGDFTVFHRLYDACNITVVSSKNTVGFYDMNSKVWIEE